MTPAGNGCTCICWSKRKGSPTEHINCLFWQRSDRLDLFACFCLSSHSLIHEETANQSDLYWLNMFSQLNVGHSTDAHMKLSEGWLVSLVCWCWKLAGSLSFCSNSHVTVCGRNWEQTFIWYVSRSFYMHSKANIFFCWKLFYCTAIFFLGKIADVWNN